MDTCTRPCLNRIQRSTAQLALLAALLVAPTFAQPLQPITLPKPQITGGMPLMQALTQRHTTRVFADRDLSLQTLSNLLWAAFGVNRPREVMRGMGRTAPSAMNSQDIELDVILPTGVYVYDAEQNLLHPILTGDLRASMLTEADSVLAHRPFYLFESKPEALLLSFGGLPAHVVEALLEALSQCRCTRLDECSKFRCDVFPNMPRPFD